MHWFIDFVIVAVLLFSVIKHFRLGLMHTVYSIGKFIASVLAAVILGKPIACFLADGIIGNAVTGSVYGKLNEYVGGSEGLSDFFANLPEGFVGFCGLFGVDIESLRVQYATAEGSEAVLRDMAETIASPIAEMFSAIVAYLAVFLIAFVVLSIVVMGLKKIKIPILTGIDKTLGLILGLVLGLFSASLIATAVYSGLQFLSAMNGNGNIMNVYSDSYVFKFVYDLRIFEFIRNLI